MELLDDVPDLDVIIAVGGGGLLSGTSIAATETKKGSAPLPESGNGRRCLPIHAVWNDPPSISPKTIADGLLTSLSSQTFPIVQQRVEQIVTVSEQGIIAAMKFIWERTKMIIEPSAAVAVGVLWEKKIDLTGLKVGVIPQRRKCGSGKAPWGQTEPALQ